MKSSFRSVSPTDWPANDRQLWQDALERTDLLDGNAVVARWRPSTIKTVAEGYGYAIAWLSDQDLLDPTASPTSRWGADTLRRYINDLQEHVRPATAKHRVVMLERALAAMEPGRDRSFLRQAACRLPEVPDRAGKRVRLQETAALVNLGFSLMGRATDNPQPNLRRNATGYRDGLQIALLALRPMRKKNLAMIEIGRHLVRVGEHWRLRFAGSETKTSQALDFSFPEELVNVLELYLENFRPLLCGSIYNGRRLWVGYKFAPLSAHSIQLNLCGRTEAAFGKPVNPHLFRDCAATSIAIGDPEHVRIAAAILGHRSFATTERHYNLAWTLEASRSFGNMIKQRRARASRRKGARK